MMTDNAAYISTEDILRPTPQDRSSAANYYITRDDATVALEPSREHTVDSPAAASDYAEHTYEYLADLRAKDAKSAFLYWGLVQLHPASCDNAAGDIFCFHQWLQSLAVQPVAFALACFHFDILRAFFAFLILSLCHCSLQCRRLQLGGLAKRLTASFSSPWLWAAVHCWSWVRNLI